MFKQLEIEIQKNYNYNNLAASRIPTRDEITEFIMKSTDVQFYWFLLSSDIDQEKLLLMIVDLWITIRGFSFAKSILEQYKQLHALNTSKAKALHKVIS